MLHHYSCGKFLRITRVAPSFSVPAKLPREMVRTLNFHSLFLSRLLHHAMAFVRQFDVSDDVALWSVRSFYIFAIYAIIIVRFIPDLKVRFLDYGARSSVSGREALKYESALPRWFRVQFDPVLDWLTDQTVPHDYFAHFYLICNICSSYWMFQHASVLEAMFVDPHHSQVIASWEGRTFIAMLLLYLQSLRRLYECMFVAKSSQSRMWVGHYAIGIAFYLVTNIAIWVEPSE